MKYVGAHVSIQGGVENAPANAWNIGAKAFALFTKNQRRWKASPITELQAVKFQENCLQYGFHTDHILAHDSYLINLGHPDNHSLQKSRDAFLDELKRCEILGVTKLNFHPGSHLNGLSFESCFARIAESINIAHSQTDSVVTVIENTAGQGTNVGFSFEQLAYIIDLVENKDRVGICLDTCHLFCSPSGYDMRKKILYEKTMNEFETTIGINYLGGVHLNDSKKGYKSRVDRHELIGKGQIGSLTFEWIMNDIRFDGIPLILETPNKNEWEKEIAFLYSFQK